METFKLLNMYFKTDLRIKNSEAPDASFVTLVLCIVSCCSLLFSFPTLNLLISSNSKQCITQNSLLFTMPANRMKILPSLAHRACVTSCDHVTAAHYIKTRRYNPLAMYQSSSTTSLSTQCNTKLSNNHLLLFFPSN